VPLPSDPVLGTFVEFQEHYHEERNHQGKNNVLLFPAPAPLEPVGAVASAVENASAAYSDTTVAPHEYFDQTGSQPFNKSLLVLDALSEGFLCLHTPWYGKLSTKLDSLSGFAVPLIPDTLLGIDRIHDFA
jgi:hypothetical protein